MMLVGEDNEEGNQGTDGTEMEAEATLHHLSLHALRGTHGPATIRFHGNIYGTQV